MGRRLYKTSTPAVIALILFSFGILPRTVHAETPACDEALEERAEMTAGYLKTWEQIYDWFKRYSACDEVAPAEGYSNAVVTMLADRWNQLPTLRTLIDRDERFSKFVFEHIDATTDDHDLDRVVANASLHCPKGDEQLCGTIRRQAVAARQENDRIYPPKEH
jgi:hypothetical protein